MTDAGVVNEAPAAKAEAGPLVPMYFIRILPPDTVLGSEEAQREWAAELLAVLHRITVVDPARVLVVKVNG